MSHLLIITDKAGKEIGRVAVEAGWSFREQRLPKEVIERTQKSKVTDVRASDSGTGKGKVG